MFCYLFFYTGRQNFGWASHAMAQYLGISFEKIGWISFSMLLGYAIGQLINGNLADRLSPRKMIVLGGFLSVVANICISFSSSFYLILALWASNGYFQSMAWAPGSKLISNWWDPKERGMAFGLYTMAAGASSILTYCMSILLVQEHLRWQSIFRIPVLFLLAAIIIFFLVARDKPSDFGFKNLTTTSSQPNWREGYKAAIRNPKFLAACLAIGFQSMARYALIFWVPIYFLGENYADNPAKLWSSMWLPIGMTVGAFSFGEIADKLFRGNKPVSISLGMLLCGVMALLIFVLPPRQDWLAGILMFLTGFFVYGPQANFWPLAPELLGEKYVGTGIGMMNMSAYLFAALGEPLMGRLIDLTGNRSIIFIAVTVIACLSALTILYAKPAKKQYALSH